MILRCPECGYANFNGEFFYDNDLYDPDTEKKVCCSGCSEDFMVACIQTIAYEACTMSDFKEYGSVI